MMKYNMKLDTEPFNQMKNGLKKIEYRLYDEKRKKLKIGDIIEFQKLPTLNERIKVEIIDLKTFKSFHDMFMEYSDINKDIDESVNSMYKYYSPKDEQKYGCIAISLNIIGK